MGDHVPEVKVLTTLGMFAVPVTAETTIGEIRQKVQEWKPEFSLEQIELVTKDKDAWGPLFNKTSRPRDDDETVESLLRTGVISTTPGVHLHTSHVLNYVQYMLS